MRLVVLATKDFALPMFRALLADGRHPILALVTQPERPQGRKQELLPSRIKQEALIHGIPVLQPEDVNAPEAVAAIRDLGADLLVTAAYGQILSAELLAVTPLGGINLHGSVLPRLRGAAPVARAILRGEPETGITVIRMTPRLDAGGMLRIERTPIGPDETAAELEARLAELGAPLVLQAIDALESGTAEIIPQDETAATRAPKLAKKDAPIRWERPAARVHDQVRALQPWPVAETTWHPADARRLPLRLLVHRTKLGDRPVSEGISPGTVVLVDADVLSVAAGDRSTVDLLELQVPGKRVLSVAEFLRGYPIRPGDRLGPAST